MQELGGREWTVDELRQDKIAQLEHSLEFFREQADNDDNREMVEMLERQLDALRR